MELIDAIQKNEALVEEMDSLLGDRQHYFLWWLGQSGFLLQWHGKRLLLDPYLSDSLTHKYAETEKPHIRMSERVVAPGLLRHIDVVTSSHFHTDHCDADTLIPILHNNPGVALVIPEANRELVAERLHCDRSFPAGLSDGQFVTVGPFSIHGIPAAHNELERDEQGNSRYMGYVVRFGQYTLYHSGDTLWFDGLKDWLQPFDISVALLPINGNKPERKVAGNLDAQEAAQLAKAIGAKTVIPCHYDMFTFNTADVTDFTKACTAIGQHFVVLQGGERFTDN